MFSFFRNLWARIKGFFHRDDDDGPRRPGDDIVAYYGCPNSEKAQKLQLGRKALR